MTKPYESIRPYESTRIEHGFVPGPFTGVKGWARYHRKAGTPPTKIKGNPDRYSHSAARTRGIKWQTKSA